MLSDADLERAANLAVYYSMQNAGQTCISIERVYVEAPVYDEFVGKVTEKVRALRVGAPHGPGSVDVGAITFPPQLDTISEHVGDAVDKGARVLVGGKAVENVSGRFFEPTVLVDVDHTMKIMTEETFGPTLPIMKVADADEARAPGQRVPLRPRRVGVHARHRARRGDRTAPGSGRGERQRRDRSTTRRSSCRWAAPRPPASAPATAPAASASTAPSRRSSSRRGSR